MEAEEFVITSVDESNAYGAMFRSKGLEATREETPHLAGITVAELQNGYTVVWQRVGAS